MSKKSSATPSTSASSAPKPAAGPSLKELTVKVSKAPNESLALTNNVFLHPDDAKALDTGTGPAYIKCSSSSTPPKTFIFTFQGNAAILKGTIGLSGVQRILLNYSLNEEIKIKTWKIKKPNSYLASTKLDVDFLQSKIKREEAYEASQLDEVLKKSFANQVFTVGQKFIADVGGMNLSFVVSTVEVADLASLADPGSVKPADAASTTKKPIRGILLKQTQINLEKAQGSSIKIQGAATTASSLFRPDFNFENLGIGGLDKEFGDIFRRAFASRVFPAAVVKKLGIQHAKGILLYGPPGTGKTLMARQIGKMLNAREPKIVNGPEVLNKYVGQSEENIRALFKDAEIEYRERQDESDLHIVIFDELDAICRARGSTSASSGVGDSVVNQLLAKMDGVERLNNILVIGMTNRKELIDEALLRPGRLEVHMEIHLPDEHGRAQILRIHTNSASKNGYLAADVDLAELATLTKNFSGAEIEGLVKSATSFALNRQIDAANPKTPLNPDAIRINRSDFLNALEEVKPAFGVSEETLENCMANGIVDFGPEFKKLVGTCKLLIDQCRNSSRTPLISVLLDGPVGSGKTALAAKVAVESGFPYVKIVSPEELVGYQEGSKCLKITKIFEDAYKSPLSLIIVDDIERLLDYVRIGPRFSNAVLQTLLVLFKKPPPKGKKLIIIGTTSNREILEDMEFGSSFDAVIPVPLVRGEEVKTVVRASGEKDFADSDLEKIGRMFDGLSIPIKKLIMVTEMARQSHTGSIVEAFASDYGADARKGK